MSHRSESGLTADRPGFSHPDARAESDTRPPAFPTPLSRLLRATDDKARSDAWAAFLEQYSRLLLKTSHRASTMHDEAMDHYAFILEQLRQNDFSRLREFAADGRGRFTTWLVVVARRLCIDHHRRVHGRPQTDHASGSAGCIEQTARRNLVTLLAGEFDLERLEDSRTPGPDAAVFESERHDAVVQALSTLDEADQLLLTLRFRDDLPLARIGPLVGLDSRFQVHRRLKSILARLRGVLEDRGFTHS